MTCARQCKDYEPHQPWHTHTHRLLRVTCAQRLRARRRQETLTAWLFSLRQPTAAKRDAPAKGCTDRTHMLETWHCSGRHAPGPSCQSDRVGRKSQQGQQGQEGQVAVTIMMGMDF